MSAPETCPKESWDGWRSFSCGRPVKRDGLCGVHAGAKDRVEKNAAKRASSRAERAAVSEALVTRLARHGIKARVYPYNGSLDLPSAATIADALDAKYVDSDGAA